MSNTAILPNIKAVLDEAISDIERILPEIDCSTAKSRINDVGLLLKELESRLYLEIKR